MTDREQIAADWEVRGFSCDLWTDRPDQRWEGFTHATDEVVIIMEGEMEFEWKDRYTIRSVAKNCSFRLGRFTRPLNIGSMTARWLYGNCRS